jgi:GxxExxY protein
MKSKIHHITRHVYAAAQNVFAELGSGRDKTVYMDALEAEFIANPCTHAERSPAIPVFYKGRTLPHAIAADFRVFNKGIIYIVVAPKVSESFTHGLYKLLCATNHKVGILLNFGKAEPDFSRVYVREADDSEQRTVSSEQRIMSREQSTERRLSRV